MKKNKNYCTLILEFRKSGYISFSMEPNTVFLAPQLTGRRFDDHYLPANVLSDFAVLENLLFEVAKEIYLEDHPEKKRVPKGFTENYSLKLTHINPGSSIPQFLLVSLLAIGNCSESALESEKYLEKARDKIYKSVYCIEKDQWDQLTLGPKSLNFLNRIGKNLREDEAIVFNSGGSTEANLNKSVRDKISRKVERTEYTDVISFNAKIPQIDKGARTFDIDVDGTRFKYGLDRGFNTLVTKAFEEYDQETVIAIKGIGVFDTADKLKRIEQIDDLHVVNLFNVKSRIAELTKLQDNWLDGEGVAPDPELLHYFAEEFTRYYDHSSPLPAIFPTIEGNIELEWSFDNGHRVSFEINLKEMSGEYLDSLKGKVVEEIDFPLTHDGWLKLNQKIYTNLE